jgi:hypothetical protein
MYIRIQFCLTTTDRGEIQPQTLKGSVTGNTDLDNYILSSRVASDTTDADVHALCTKPAVLKMEESGKSKFVSTLI